MISRAYHVLQCLVVGCCLFSPVRSVKVFEVLFKDGGPLHLGGIRVLQPWVRVLLRQVTLIFLFESFEDVVERQENLSVDLYSQNVQVRWVRLGQCHRHRKLNSQQQQTTRAQGHPTLYFVVEDSEQAKLDNTVHFPVQASRLETKFVCQQGGLCH